MKFGLSLYAENPDDFRVPDSENYEELLRSAALAEELEFDYIQVAQHHFDPQYPPDPFILCAAIAARTEKIRIGTGIVIMPLYHPLIIAEKAAMVDVLSKGRFDLGMGVGYEATEFEALGIPRSERGSRMEEGLEVIKGLFTQENYSFEGRHFKLNNVTMSPRPVQKPHPPIWIAAERRPTGGRTPRPIERAARHGCHLTGPRDREMLRLYEEALRKYGRDPKDFFRDGIREGYVAETRERAWKDYAPHVLQQMKSYLVKYTEAGVFSNLDSAMFGVTELPSPEELPALAQSGKLTFLGQPFAVGTPDDVAKEIESDKKNGVTHCTMFMQIGGIDPRKLRHSLRLFAKEVMPHFKA